MKFSVLNNIKLHLFLCLALILLLLQVYISFYCRCYASALDDLNSWSGGYTPSVPDVPSPKIDRDYSNNYQSYDQSTDNSYQNYYYNYDSDPKPQGSRRRRKKDKAISSSTTDNQNNNAFQNSSASAINTSQINSSINTTQSTLSTPQGATQSKLSQSNSINNYKGFNYLYKLTKKFNKNFAPGKEKDKFTEIKLLLNSLKNDYLLPLIDGNFLNDLYILGYKLWKKIILDPTLSHVDRIKYQLPLLIEAYKSRSVSFICKNYFELIKNAPVYENKFVMPFEENITDLMVSAVEQMGTEVSEKIPPHKYDYIIGSPDKHYENVLGITKVTIKVLDSDYPAAIGEGLDFLIGKITYVPAQFAATVGKMYANLSFKVFDKFIRDASDAVSYLTTGNQSNYNTKEFWNEYYNELNTIQKGIFEWLGGPINEDK